MRFQDKVVIVTGGSMGIGGGLAIAFAQEGAKIMIADIKEEQAAETMNIIRQAGGTVNFVKTDLTNVEEIKNLVKETVKTYGGKIDILLNIAGVCINDPLLETREAIWDLTFDVNVKGGFFLTEEVAKIMKENGGGVVVNTSSTSSFLTSTGPSLAYDISKGAVRAMIMNQANWYGQYGIRVNGFAPSTTNTDMVKNLFPPGFWQGEWVRALFPLGRIAEVEDHINAVMFLCSEDAAYINGQIIMTDGAHYLLTEDLMILLQESYKNIEFFVDSWYNNSVKEYVQGGHRECTKNYFHRLKSVT